MGHGWSALLTMDLARARGGSFRLRIEDIDGTRSRPEHVAGIVEDLRWLGIAWDGDIVFQSARLDHAGTQTSLRAMEQHIHVSAADPEERRDVLAVALFEHP